MWIPQLFMKETPATSCISPPKAWSEQVAQREKPRNAVRWGWLVTLPSCILVSGVPWSRVTTLRILGRNHSSMLAAEAVSFFNTSRLNLNACRRRAHTCARKRERSQCHSLVVPSLARLLSVSVFLFVSVAPSLFTHRIATPYQELCPLSSGPSR